MCYNDIDLPIPLFYIIEPRSVGSSDIVGAGLSAESAPSKMLLADREALAPMRECGVICSWGLP